MEILVKPPEGRTVRSVKRLRSRAEIFFRKISVLFQLKGGQFSGSFGEKTVKIART